MSTRIELFAGSSVTLIGTVSLGNVLRRPLERMLGVSLSGASIKLELVQIVDNVILAGTPTVYNVAPEFGYAYVTVTLADRIIYRHPHPLSELINQPLQELLQRAYPDESLWGFRIAVPGLDRNVVRQAPSVDGAAPITPYEPGEAPTFGIRRLAEPTPPDEALESFGVTADATQMASPVKVIVAADVYHDLLGRRRLSAQVEEGGFLVGDVYRDRDADGTFVAHIARAPSGEQTGASFLHFTFTGDSFTAIKRTLRHEASGHRLLGWYHTHLFAAAETMGLSSIDLKLHFSTFTLPWQLAGLINIDDGQRTLRFYVRQGDEMVLCPHWMAHEQP